MEIEIPVHMTVLELPEKGRKGKDFYIPYVDSVPPDIARLGVDNFSTEYCGV